MQTKYGVISAAPLNIRLKNGYTLYDWVKKTRVFSYFLYENTLW